MTAPATRPAVRAVIFDLDGTLVQTRVASWEVFSRISDRFGLGIDRPEQYFDMFRSSNVFTSIRTLCRDDAHAAEVKEAFLALLRDDYTPPLVPGMTDVVRRLASDCTLAVISSNAMQVLRRVLVSHDLAFCFAHVFGGDIAPDKRLAIEAFLADSGSGFGRRCTADYDETGRRSDPGPNSTVLVTDTAGDVRDALAAGIRVVGVAWGMHTVDELTAAGAEFVAIWPQEVSAYLLREAAVEGPSGGCVLPPETALAGATATAGCGCGCSTPATGTASDLVDAAGVVRRSRRRAGALPMPASTPGRGTATGNRAQAELLAAVQRVCGGELITPM